MGVFKSTGPRYIRLDNLKFQNCLFFRHKSLMVNVYFGLSLLIHNFLHLDFMVVCTLYSQ